MARPRSGDRGAVAVKLAMVIGPGAHLEDDAHAIRAGEATEQVRRRGGRTRWPELEMTTAFRLIHYSRDRRGKRMSTTESRKTWNGRWSGERSSEAS
jgi:hypothetical protein